jgi:hypothetical protein
MNDDIPLQVAAASAALVHDKWLPGLKEAEAAGLVLELSVRLLVIHSRSSLISGSWKR